MTETKVTIAQVQKLLKGAVWATFFQNGDLLVCKREKLKGDLLGTEDERRVVVKVVGYLPHFSPSVHEMPETPAEKRYDGSPYPLISFHLSDDAVGLLGVAQPAHISAYLNDASTQSRSIGIAESTLDIQYKSGHSIRMVCPHRLGAPETHDELIGIGGTPFRVGRWGHGESIWSQDVHAVWAVESKKEAQAA